MNHQIITLEWSWSSCSKEIVGFPCWSVCVSNVFSFRDKLKDHDQDISKALAKLDKSKTGYISLCRLQKLLQECGCSLKEEELTDLLNRFPLSKLTVVLTALNVRLVTLLSWIFPSLSTQTACHIEVIPMPPKTEFQPVFRSKTTMLYSQNIYKTTWLN